MDLGRFSQAASDQPPCGVDLDESGELFTLDQLAAWENAQAETDWGALRDAAASALARSRDVRICCYLAGALLHTQGIAPFCNALTLLRTLLETFWDDVYPRLDDGDATERSNAIFNLTNYHKILRPLRTQPLVEDRATGRFSLFDLEVAQGKAALPADFEGDAPHLALVEAAFQAAPLEGLQTLTNALGQANEDVAKIGTLFYERAGSQAVPDLARLRETLQAMHKATATALAQRQVATVDTDGDDAPASGDGAGAATAAPRAGVRSREDVVRHIDQILQYFRVHEPTSPVPLLLSTAKRLLHMDFISIIKYLGNDTLDKFHALAGKDDDSAGSK